MTILSNAQFMHSFMCEQSTPKVIDKNRKAKITGHIGTKCRVALFVNNNLHAVLSRPSFVEAVQVIKAWQRGQNFQEGIIE